MGRPYIPRRDDQALLMMRHFANTIAAAPSVYMLSPADAAAIGRAVDEFDAAYSIAVNPNTSTGPTVRGKDQSRIAAEQIVRQYAGLIRPNAGISDGDKIAIGVNPANRSRSPIHCPASSPLLSILGATPCSHTLRYRDTSTPASSAKPFGAAQLQVFVAIADQRVHGASDARFYGSFTRNPIGIGFTHADDGKMATYFARWTSSKGEVGPWSSPVSMRIAA